MWVQSVVILIVRILLHVCIVAVIIVMFIGVTFGDAYINLHLLKGFNLAYNLWIGLCSEATEILYLPL